MSASAAPILITGASQRIGLYCAERLLDDGHALIVTYRSERDGIDRLRQRGALALQADFADEAGILAFIEQLKGHTDSLRAIVHNASIGWWKRPAKKPRRFSDCSACTCSPPI